MSITRSFTCRTPGDVSETGAFFPRPVIFPAFLAVLVLTLWMTFTPGGHLYGKDEVFNEYLAKAGLIARLASYADWPEDIEPGSAASSFVLTVIGDNPFVSEDGDGEDWLEYSFVQKKILIKKRRVELRYISEPSEIQDCHILFISGSEKKELDEILAVTHGKPILTVADTSGFGEKGVHINIYIKKSALGFEINEKEIFSSPVKLSHQVLKYARIVNPRKRR